MQTFCFGAQSFGACLEGRVLCLNGRRVHLGVSRGAGDFRVPFGGMPDREERDAQRGERCTERREQMELTKKAKRSDAGGKEDRMEVTNKGLTERVRNEEEGIRIK